MKNPCEYCVPPKRHFRCHGSCQAYAEVQAEKAVERMARIRRSEADDITIRSIIRTTRKRHVR
jgi:hypothetical protein